MDGLLALRGGCGIVRKWLLSGRKAWFGREAELELVRAVLDPRTEGEARVVLDGEAGIGKTALWQAGLDEARTRDLCTLEARPALQSKVSLSRPSAICSPMSTLRSGAYRPLSGGRFESLCSWMTPGVDHRSRGRSRSR